MKCVGCDLETYLLEDEDGAPYMPDIRCCVGCDRPQEECTCRDQTANLLDIDYTEIERRIEESR